MNRTTRRRSAAGFTFIETLIAGAILVIIAIGILPIFIRSMANNATGGELTQKVNSAESRLEEYYPLNVDNPNINWSTGTVRTTTNFYTRGVNPNANLGAATDRGWVTEGTLAQPVPAMPTGRGAVQWTRETRIQTYNIQEFEDSALNDFGELPPSFPPTPMLGSASIDMRHFELIEVDLSNATARYDAINTFNATRLTAIKTF